MNLRLSNNTISGNLMGTPVTGMTRAAFGGTSHAAGLYDISPPVSDPVFGMYAILTPATGPSSGGSAQAFVRHRVGVGSETAEKWSPATVAGKIGGSAAWLGDVMKQLRAMKVEGPKGAGPVYVLSDRPIPGRNCIVMSLGFADLMNVLGSAGGGQITIA